MTHCVALLVGLMSVAPAAVEPAAAQPVVAPEGAEPAGAVVPADPSGLPDATDATDATNTTNTTDATNATDPDNTVLQIVEPPPDPDVQRVPEERQYAVPLPLPGRRSRDPALRKARGMLAGGIIFTALCSVGSVAVIVAGVYQPPSASDRADYVRGAAALITCTVGSIALASYGGVRIRKIRGLAEWTGGLGLRF